jgi:uncharacterized membrane-anchored protein YjiN (DUF445 family)
MTMTQSDDSHSPASRAPRARHYGRSATLLLIVMAAVMVAVSQIEDPGFWAQLARAGSEAALVGGLADWFAVTALFRHPLGLPIPHTSVVARNKDRIGHGLGAFVEEHILDPTLILGRLRTAQLARRIGLWLSRRRNAARAADQIAAVVPFLMNGLSDRQVQDFLRRVFSQMGKVELAPLLGTVLQLLREGGRHQELFDRGLAAARDYLLANEATIYRMVEDRSSWWVPSRIDRRVAQAILHGIADLLSDMARRDHDVRRKFDAAVEGLIGDLRQSPDVAARVAAIRDQILGSAEMQAYLAALWNELKAAVTDDQNNPASGFRRALADSLRSFGVTLARDPAARAWLDQWFETLARSAISPFRMEIGRFIADVVRGWEAQTIAERIESAVGRDLQYIRINGTIVGAVVGCGLFLIARFVL